jgi:hypothetical protein
MELHVALVQQNTDSDSMVTKRVLENVKGMKEFSGLFVPFVYYAVQLVTIAVSRGYRSNYSSQLSCRSM